MAESREERVNRLLADDPQFRGSVPLPAVTAAINEPGLGVARVVAITMEAYADRPALAQRATRLATADGRTSLELLPRFEAITYRELWTRVRAVASAWQYDATHPVSAGDFVCTIGAPSTDYTIVDLACIHSGLVAVPLQAGASPAALGPVVAEVEPRVLAASIDQLATAAELALGSDSLRHLLVFDYHEEVDDQRDRFEAVRHRLAGSPVVLDSMPAALGRAGGLPSPSLADSSDDDRLSALIYTSGSTGAPKGAMYTDLIQRALWQPAFITAPDGPSISICLLPMNHLAGRASLAGTLSRGGIVHFPAKTDMSTLFEDLALVRPTDLQVVPRIGELLTQQYQSELGRRPGRSEEILAEFRDQVLGGRLVNMACVGAPLSAELRAFIESGLGVPVRDGYASTEAQMITIDGRVQRPPVLDYKLVDMPEQGYFTTDVPHPRGELRVRSEALVPGYFKRPDITAAMFDEEGYYRTGDIVAELGPDHLVYVDRTTNVIKLSQGEFVALARLEAIFVASPLVAQIFVYGSSERAYLLAVVVPTRDAVEQHGSRLARAVRDSLQEIGTEAGLSSHEIPRDVLIEPEPFSVQNRLLTGAGKAARGMLTKHYAPQLAQLYVHHAQEQEQDLRELRVAGRERPVLETISLAAQSLLDIPAEDLDPDARFADLGGDSLSALSFGNLLQDIYDVEVPVSVVTSPATDLRGLARYVEDRLESGAHRPTFASVHGAGATEVRAADLTLDAFIDAAVLDAAANLPRPAAGPRTVLLTGANGYLGRFLCLEWLEHAAETGSTLVCLVRGSTADAARARLEAAFDSGDPALAHRFRQLSEGRLEVLAGDVGEPRLGLDEQTWARLADAVDLVVHPAALVNHVLPYSQLFGPNVVGTAEVIRLALTTRLKPVTFLSTVVVGAQVVAPGLDEDADIRATSPVRTIDTTYADGYGTSKWAGEVLLREAHEHYGLPVTVFRAGMILAHSNYRGQLNVPDMFTRLLLSLVASGIAPDSFYRGEGGHYDGLPADFAAEAIAALGEQVTEGFHTFNVVNPHDDGISLDVVVDWLTEAGRPVLRIGGYDTWISRFETALRGLPEEQRQHSLLPLLDAYRAPEQAHPGSAVPSQRFAEAVRTAKIGRDGDIPHLSKALIEKYLTDLEHLGLL